MEINLFLLLTTTVTIAFVHTIAGPDHYLPFIALAKAKNWSKLKTLIIVILCGIGHILSSVIIGFIGIGAGIAIHSINALESSRGEIAGLLFISFGLVYTVWGIKKSFKNKPHIHSHFHTDGDVHTHNHIHSVEHAHIHLSEKQNVTPWVLFIVFVFGPCEPLIPLVMYPAASSNYFVVCLVTIIFGVVTIISMIGLTFLGIYGINLLPVKFLEKNIHVIAGATILICGIGIKFLGL